MGYRERSVQNVTLESDGTQQIAQKATEQLVQTKRAYDVRELEQAKETKAACGKSNSKASTSGLIELFISEKQAYV